MTNTLFQQATDIIRQNDRGHYTVPTHGLYPFQWNWDSCLAAMGIAYIDEVRAWQEIETLFAHQWQDGMVPHIIFHEQDDGYFPGPEIWNTGRETPTTGITQPAVAGFAIRRLFERAVNQDLAQQKATELITKVAHWHEWFYQYRDPEDTGLVAILHPWESGRDNSVDWDEAFANVPTQGVKPYTRRDTKHADPAHRPTQAQYDRYIWLVQHFLSLQWDNEKLHDESPFQMVDPGFNAILIRSCSDLAALAEKLGMEQLAKRQRELAKQGLQAMNNLWSDKHQQYLCLDRHTNQLVDSASSGGLLPIFADINPQHAAIIADRIQTLSQQCRYLLPSHDPADSRFDSKRYWRGPSWLIINYMVADGLEQHGFDEMAKQIKQQSLELIKTHGFAEYYDPLSGESCGGDSFTWTAAMVLEFL
jgi:hypothetical protein